MMEIFLSSPYSIIGAVLLPCFVAYLAWRNGRKVRVASACAAFRAAVLTELGSIYPKPAAWPDNIDAFLKGRFPGLQTAVENFRPFVPWWSRRGFNYAWRIYRLGMDGREIDGQYYSQYEPHKIDGFQNGVPYKYDNTLTYQENFKTNVHRLLYYAKET